MPSRPGPLSLEPKWLQFANLCRFLQIFGPTIDYRLSPDSESARLLSEAIALPEEDSEENLGIILC